MSLNVDKMISFKTRMTEVSRSVLFGSSLLLGDELGYFRALRGVVNGLSIDELASTLKIDRRYTQEWLLNMLAFDVVTYNCDTQRYILSDEYAAVLVDESSPHFNTGMIQFAVGCSIQHDKLQHAIRNGTGLAWSDLDERVINGLRRWNRVGYEQLLIKEWISKVDSRLLSKLDNGSLVCDVGCGAGIATMELAQHFPKSTFIGYDYDPKSVAMAAQIATQRNITNIDFVVAGATEFGKERTNNKPFDVVCFFAAFHDMSNPSEVIAYVKSMLSADGFVFMVEPWAADNLLKTCDSPAGALLAAVSLHYCTPCAKSYSSDKSLIMGAVCPTEEYMKLWVQEGGFTAARIVPVENSPNNRVFEIQK